MSRWSVTAQSFLPVGVLNTAAFTDLGYAAIQGSSSTLRIKVYDVLLGGQAAASSPTPMLFSRDTTIGATSLTFVGMGISKFDPSAQSLTNMPALLNASTTKPQRSATEQMLNLGFNAWGGIIHWAALDPTEVIEMLGNTQPYGEASLSCMTGGTPGNITATVILEVQ